MTSTQPEPARRMADDASPSWENHVQSRPSRAFPEPAEAEWAAAEINPLGQVSEPAGSQISAQEPAPAGPEVSPRDQAPEPVAPEIATLDQAPEPAEASLLNPATGEPRRPWTIRLGSAACFAAVANLIGALLWLYWNAIPVPVDGFAHAGWLLGIVPAEPGSAIRVILVSAATLIALLAVVPLTITGYYSWQGYRWTRVSALISLALSFGALTLNPAAWSSIGLAALAAGLLWLPQGKPFFAAWQALRHPEPVFAPPTFNVQYGPARPQFADQAFE